MSNIHGLGSYKKTEKKDDLEEFMQGGKTSGTSVLRPTQGAGRDDFSTKALAAHARSQQQGGDAPAGNIGQITLYSNGFRIGEGEFRSNEDSKTKEFIRELKMGQVPRELEDEVEKQFGTNVDKVGVSLVDKSSEAFDAPKPKFDFSKSHGLSLGGAKPAASAVKFDVASEVATAYVVKEGGDKTRVQVVLHDRKKVTVAINKSASIRELYQHVKTLSDLPTFGLFVGFPPKCLTDPYATIEEAKLAGSQIPHALTVVPSSVVQASAMHPFAGKEGLARRLTLKDSF